MAKIIHEREKCIGCGACVAACPDYWEIKEDGKTMLLGSKVNSKSKNYELEVQEIGCSQNAADSCPISIIHIEK